MRFPKLLVCLPVLVLIALSLVFAQNVSQDLSKNDLIMRSASPASERFTFNLDKEGGMRILKDATVNMPQNTVCTYLDLSNDDKFNIYDSTGVIMSINGKSIPHNPELISNLKTGTFLDGYQIFDACKDAIEGLDVIYTGSYAMITQRCKTQNWFGLFAILNQTSNQCLFHSEADSGANIQKAGWLTKSFQSPSTPYKGGSLLVIVNVPEEMEVTYFSPEQCVVSEKTGGVVWNFNKDCEGLATLLNISKSVTVYVEYKQPLGKAIVELINKPWGYILITIVGLIGLTSIYLWVSKKIKVLPKKWQELRQQFAIKHKKKKK